MPSDQYWSNVVLLLHCEQSGNSTNAIDSSSVGKTFTKVFTVSFTGAQAKYGDGSLVVDTNGRLECDTAPDADFDFGAGDFTTEGYLRGDAFGGNNYTHLTNVFGTWAWSVDIEGSSIAFYCDTIAGGTFGAAGGTFTGAFKHWAICRAADTIRLFIDGVQVATIAIGTNTIKAGGRLRVNSYDASGFAGHGDEIRITKGVARYTGAFAPPTEAFPEGAGTPGPTISSGAAYQFLADLETPGGTVRVPISSWQSTLRTSESSYAQIVIPDAGTYADDIADATEFAVFRRALTRDGAIVGDDEIVRFPVQTIQFDRGPWRHTATVSGFQAGYAVDPNPDAANDRVLTGVRQTSTGATSMRIRADIDIAMRPQFRAYLDAVRIQANYVSFYVSLQQAYMDVGGLPFTIHESLIARAGNSAALAAYVARPASHDAAAGAGYAASAESILLEAHSAGSGAGDTMDAVFG